VPANVGVNPSLTITAMTERAMSKIPVAPGGTPHEPVGISDHPGKTAVSSPEQLLLR
jgi:cholesterol oxidase